MICDVPILLAKQDFMPTAKTGRTSQTNPEYLTYCVNDLEGCFYLENTFSSYTEKTYLSRHETYIISLFQDHHMKHIYHLLAQL